MFFAMPVVRSGGATLATVLGGTAGSIIFSDGTNLTQDNANLFWDDTNNRIGIGTASPSAQMHVAGIVKTTGSPTELLVATAAHTTLTASTEASSVRFNMAATVQFATGALVRQAAFQINAPTYAFVGASTITSAATVYIDNSPQAGAFATISTSYAIWVDAGDTRLDGRLGVGGALATGIGVTLTEAVSTSGSPGALRVVGAAHTNLTASTEAVSIDLDLDATVQFATGALATQRAIFVRAPTYGFVGASTLSDAATFYIDAAPIAGTFATITNSYAVWVDAGIARLDGRVSVGGTGPATAVQLTVTEEIATSGSPTALRVVSGAHTTLAASTEATAIEFDIDNIVQFATGALVNQRAVRIVAPQYAFVGASTITNASTLAIDAAPSAGAFATISNAYALNVAAGVTRLGGRVIVGQSSASSTSAIHLVVDEPVATSGTPTAFRVTGGAHTNLTASTEAVSIDLDLDATVQFATGAIANQRAVFVRAPTYGFVGASTITSAATVYIDNSPQAGANATLSTSYAIWVDDGIARFDGETRVGGIFGAGAAPGVRVQVDITEATYTTGAPIGLRITNAPHTTLTASGEANFVLISMPNTVQYATGAIAAQRAVRIIAPTYGFVGASTISDAATFYITDAPTAGANATFTRAMAIWVDAGTTRLDGQVGVGGMPAAAFQLDVTEAVATSGTPTAFRVTVGAHTTLAAGTEAVSVSFALGTNTVQFATGAIATQRAVIITAPDYAFVGTSTITRAATVYVSAAPSAGAFATITNSYALWIDAGIARLDGRVYAGTPTEGGTTPYQLDVWEAVGTSGSPGALRVNGAAHTTLAASTEANAVQFALNQTVQFATGALTTQRCFRVYAPTYAFVGTSTLTDAATFYIDAAPIAGAFATIVNSYALWVDAGETRLDGTLGVGGDAAAAFQLDVTEVVATTGSPTAFRVTGGAHTTLTASAEAVSIDFDLDATVQFATGALGTQRAIFVRAPTYAFVGASTLTNAATLYIDAAPTAGTFATITNSYAFWVDAGNTRLDGALELNAIITPAALGAGETNNYSPTGLATASWLRQDVSAAGALLSGLALGVTGKYIVITNISTTGANTLTLEHADASSDAGNRFTCPNAVDFVIPSLGSAVVFYNGTNWTVM